jgi:monoamine oxidase
MADSDRLSRRRFVVASGGIAAAFSPLLDLAAWDEPAATRREESQREETPRRVDVAIIGGGLAGLTAARRLVASGIDSVIVLEARTRTGGRTMNQKIAGGHVVEGGGQWVGPTQTRKALVLDSLAKGFGEKARSPIDYVEMNWGAEKWNAGCVSPVPPGLLSRFGPALRKPVGRVHWAGAETSEIWTGYMDGAVRSGERVATEIKKALEA